MRLNPWRQRFDIHVYVAEYAARIDIGPAIRRVEGPNLEAVRTEAVRMLVALAVEQGRDFRVLAHGPEGETPLMVSASGIVTVDANTAAGDRGTTLGVRLPVIAMLVVLAVVIALIMMLVR
ncbi:hypothetical protein MU582_09505 [Nocardioidaceae bacterium SCSIO 66511]|nr:hypothetical protein MU582_09505 [Nocardioidaceae bacterium SCSIO 66511]